jgi:adenylate cyclase
LPETEHKSAAIMFTEMVGHRDRLGQDESLAKHLLGKQRSIIRQSSSGHGGKYFGEDLAPNEGIGLKGWLTGAGARKSEMRLRSQECIVLFDSALEATQCAVEIQRTLREHNREAPTNKDIYVRIGIHIGNVAERMGELSGEAVAVASKVAALAEPGGICLSEQARNQVRDRSELSFLSLGSHELKNVPRPLKLYGVDLQGNKETAVGEAPDSRRFAVLPFANISPDPKDEYFADGMTEEVISTISNIREFDVISRTSAMGYKGTTKKVEEIARELGVGSILEGSVRKAGDKIRVTVQLISVKSDRHMWAQSYDRELRDVFAVQSDIAKEVAQALRVRILPEETLQIEKKPTKSTEAYTLYLKGRYCWNERTTESVLKAIEYFKQAIRLDPKYALAYSGMADSYSYLGTESIQYGQAFSLSEENAAKAVQLDDLSAEAHSSLANALLNDYDWSGAEREFKKAIELNPNYAMAHQGYGGMLLRCGRLDESLREILRAQELDPLSPMITTNCGTVYDRMGKHDLAKEQVGRVLDLNPNFLVAHYALWWIYMHERKYEEAEREAREALRLANNHPRVKAYLAPAYAFGGKEAEARSILDEVSRARNHSYIPDLPFIMAYLGLGDREKAVELIQRAFESRANWLPNIVLDPIFSSIRFDPRVVEILKKIGIAS